MNLDSTGELLHQLAQCSCDWIGDSNSNGGSNCLSQSKEELVGMLQESLRNDGFVLEDAR